MHVPQSHSSGAFSLAEVMIAMGIFAGTLLFLLALFPLAESMKQQSIQSTRSTLIAQSMMECLTCEDSSAPLRVATKITNDGFLHWKLIQPESTTTILLGYNEACEPLQELDPAVASLPLMDSRMIAVASLTITPSAFIPNMLIAEIAISSPASAPQSRRIIHRFTSMLVAP